MKLFAIVLLVTFVANHLAAVLNHRASHPESTMMEAQLVALKETRYFFSEGVKLVGALGSIIALVAGAVVLTG